MFTFSRAIPEEVGIPSSAIKEFLMYLDKKDIPMHSVLIMKDDKLVFEKYYAPYRAETLHRMFSISKSFTALAVSLLIDEGKIGIDESITTYFPEYTNGNTHNWIRETTIRNMLMMRTCHAACTYKVDMTSNWVESFFTVEPTHKPGTVFHYDTSAAHVLCALVEKMSGTDMLSYLQEKVLKYLDFSEDAYMVKDPFGVSMGGSGLMATPMDILKVLYLLNKKGTVICADGEKRTLLNPEFIEEATANLSDTIMTGPVPSESVGYGMQIWQNEADGFVMYGMGGQLAISIPDKKMLIMTTADTQGIQGGNQIIYDGIYNILLPVTKLTPNSIASKEDKASYKDLVKAAENLEIGLPKLGIAHVKCDTENFYSKELKYNLYPNKSGFETMAVRLSDDGFSTLCFSAKDSAGNTHEYFICFGLSKMSEGPFPIYGTHYTAGGMWLRENVLFIKVHLIGESVGSIRFELYFGDKDVTVFMRKIEETYFKEFDGHLYGTL